MKKAFQALVLGFAICFQLITPMMAGVGSFVAKHFQNNNVAATIAAHAPIAHADSVNQNSGDTTPGCGFGIFSNSSVMGCVAQVAYFLFVYVLGSIASIAGDLFDYFLWFTIDSETYGTKNDVIQKGWDVVRDVTNIFFVVGLLIAAISILFNIGESGGPRLLFSIIVIALIINFSLFFVRVVIDAGNITGLIFYNKITADPVKNIASEGPGGGLKSISSVLMSKFNPQELYNTDLFTNYGLTDSAKAGRFLLMTVFVGVLHLILIIVFVNVCLFFISRVIALWFSMIFAPFALVTKAIPFLNTEKLKFLNFNEWIRNLLSNAFLVGVFMFLIYIVALLSTDITVGIQQSANSTDNFAFLALKVGMPFMLVAMFLWIAKKAAQGLAGEFGEMVTTGIGYLAAGAVGTVAGAAVLSGGALSLAGSASKALGGKQLGETLQGAGKAVNPFKWKKSTNPYLRGAGKALGGVGTAGKWVAGKTLGIDTGLIGKAAAIGALGGPSFGKTWNNIKKEAWEDEKKAREEALANGRLGETIQNEQAQMAAREREDQLDLLRGAEAATQNDMAREWQAGFQADLENAMQAVDANGNRLVTDINQWIKDYKAGNGQATIYAKDAQGNWVANGTNGANNAEVRSAASLNAEALNNAADNLTYGDGYIEARADARNTAAANGQKFDEAAWRAQEQAQGRFQKTQDATVIQTAAELRNKAKPDKTPPSEKETELAYRQYRNAQLEEEKTRGVLERILTATNATRAANNQLTDIMQLSDQHIKDFVDTIKSNTNDIRNVDGVGGNYTTVNVTNYEDLEVQITRLENDAKTRQLTQDEVADLVKMKKDKTKIDDFATKNKESMKDLLKHQKTQNDAKKVIAQVA